MAMKIYGLSRTRDSKGNVVKQEPRDWVNCIHTNVGSAYETMQVLVLEYEEMAVLPINTSAGGMEKYRVRKLTPSECFRLMGVRDAEIGKIQSADISDSQQYKMAGNSIVVDVLMGIFKQMFAPEYITDSPILF